MRLFQHFEVYPAYQARMSAVTRRINDYVGKLRFLLDDRCEALHLLQPVLDGDVSAFATSGMSSDLQCSWAREHGLKSATPLVDILLAQIEEHRTEVFYDLAPLRFDGSLLRRLPGCVKKTIAWHAAPSFGVDFPYYNLVVSNFPNILELQRRRGCKTAFFYPAYDPEMADYAANRDRPIDVLFVGSYSRHHRRRAQLLEEFASLASEMSIQFFLNSSRFTQFAESTLGKMLPLAKYRRPNTLSAVTHPPIFGRDLYRAMSQSKVVLNAAIDMAGRDRGNLRCFEGMGCGCLLYSDDGDYPEGMTPGVTIEVFASIATAIEGVVSILGSAERLQRIASAGHQTISTRYSKARQWEGFVQLVQ